MNVDTVVHEGGGWWCPDVVNDGVPLVISATVDESESASILNQLTQAMLPLRTKVK